jgi:integrase
MVFYYEGGRQRKYGLGSLDHFKRHSIDEIRNEAAAILKKVKDGRDPIAERKTKHAEGRSGRTVKALTELYLKEVERKNRSADQVRHSLEKHVLPRFGNRLVSSLKRQEIAEWHESIEAPVAANRALSWFRAMLTFAVKRGWIDTNPATLVDKNSESPRERVLSAEERDRLINVCRPYAQDFDTELGQLATAVMLLLETGARVTEITNARWTEVDTDTGVIVKSSKASKSKKPRVIHLTNAARAILSTLPRGGKTLFPLLANRHAGSFSYTWYQLRDEAGLQGDPDEKIPPFQLRDTRRTFATEIHNKGIPLEIVSKMLGHATTQVTQRVYARLQDHTVAAALAKLDEAETTTKRAVSARAPRGGK